MQTSKQADALSYAAVVRSAGDRVECLRLASCLASSSLALAAALGLQIDVDAVSKSIAEIVSRYYKVHVPAESVHRSLRRAEVPEEKAKSDTQDG